LGSKYGRIKGILWHQGEQDNKDEKYLEKLIPFIQNLRKDLKNPKLPFIAGEINKKTEFNKRLNALTKKLGYTAVVSSKGLTATDM